MDRRIIKRVLCLILATTIIVGCIFAPENDVYAKQSKYDLNLTYKGKTVTIIKASKNSYWAKPIYLKTLKRAWGKPAKNKNAKKLKNTEYSENLKYYMYKENGFAYYFKTDKKSKELGGGYEIQIKKKGIKLNGVQVGMNKEKAMKKLASIYGKKNVKYGYWFKDCISVQFSGYLPILYYVKNNKVSKIVFSCS